MKKKILLSTFLSSLIFTSFNAKADIIIDFTPQGKMLVEGKVYSNYITFSMDYVNRITSNEKVVIPPAGQARFLEALINDKNLRLDWYTNFAVRTNGNIGSLENFNEIINQILKVLKEEKITARELIDLIQTYNVDILRLLNSSKKSISEIPALLKKKIIKEKFKTLNKEELTNLKKQAPKIEDLEDDDKDDVMDINTKIKKIDELFSKPEFLAKKKSAEFQDELKDIINEIKEAQLVEDGDPEEQFEYAKIILGKFITKNPKVASDLTPVQAPEGKTAYGVFNAVNPVTSDIGVRLNNFVGVSAGSIAEKAGAWAKGIYSTGEQKATGLADGFKYNLKGGSIGADMGEQHVFGIAYSYLNNEVTSTLKNTTKDEIQLHVLSAYGMLSPNNELFLSGQFQYGTGVIKKTRATGDSQKNIAKAEPKSDLIRVSGQIGYAFIIPNTDGSIVPTIGINHSTVNMDGYTEKGSGLNRTIEKMSFNRTAGTFGISYKYTIKNNETIIEPEIHANGDYAFNIKNDDTKITLIKGLDPIVVPSEKTQKFLYGVGASIKFSPSRMVEINGGYDFTGGKNFTAHTGTVTLRVNF